LKVLILGKLIGDIAFISKISLAAARLCIIKFADKKRKSRETVSTNWVDFPPHTLVRLYL